MKRISVFLFAMTCLLPVYAMGEAMPKTINYQGQVVDLNGNPINRANCPIKIKLYEVAVGGTIPSWSDSFKPDVRDGYFDIVLGSGDYNLDSLNFNKQYYVELEVDGETMSPRQPLNSVPYAMQAEKANTANTVADGAISRQAQAPFAPVVYFRTTTLSNNVRILCGAQNSGADGYSKVNFSPPFSVEPVITLTVKSGGTAPHYVNIRTQSATGFEVNTFANLNLAGPITFQWIAIGR